MGRFKSPGWWRQNGKMLFIVILITLVALDHFTSGEDKIYHFDYNNDPHSGNADKYYSQD